MKSNDFKTFFYEELELGLQIIVDTDYFPLLDMIKRLCKQPKKKVVKTLQTTCPLFKKQLKQ